MNKIYLISILLVSGCVQQMDTPSSNAFFSKDFLKKTVQQTGTSNFSKTVHFNQEQETKTFTLDSLALQKELNPFYQLNLTKEELISSFTKDSNSVDNKRYTIVYTKKEGTPHHIHQLEETFKNKKIVKIKGSIIHNTPLFFSEKQLELSLNEGAVSSYSIFAKQCMIGQDTNTFHIEGKKVLK
ncbi:MAG: hypothetical protein GY827_00985 [Cytophagales bacterium]|nr:hypothetical protein [Cytophagales bacterium]